MEKEFWQTQYLDLKEEYELLQQEFQHVTVIYRKGWEEKDKEIKRLHTIEQAYEALVKAQ